MKVCGSPENHSVEKQSLPLLPPLLPQVGDGTTSVVLLAGEILKNCKPFIEDNVHPQVWATVLRQGPLYS